MTTTKPLTVGQLKAMLDKLPDSTELWVFNQNEGTFLPVEDAAPDKRSKSFNLWVNT